MTAEIAVMNKWAVALAADSKVTISGMRASKAYDTVNKLFTLSKVHPVGIMVFGNAEFMEYPWETIIKLYREQKGRANESYVVDWGADFLAYLKTFGRVDDGHKGRNITNICASWLAEFVGQAADVAPSRGIAVGSAEYKTLLTDMFKSQTRDILELDRWASLRDQRSVVTKYGKQVAGVIESFLGSFDDDDLRKAAVHFLLVALFHDYYSPQSSGFVIAGFGEQEYFPTVAEFTTDGYIGNKIKVASKEVADVSRSMSSCIRAFAQGDMVERFMNGVDSDFMNVLIQTFSNSLEQSCLSVLDKYGDETNKTDIVRDEIRTAVGNAMTAIVEDADQYIQGAFSSPVIRMVALLPKDELAHLAESLVALTSLKRRVSSDAETVGGPVDVALISKGDGFVWIKRKHYFPADLNHQFARKYMDGISNGESNGPDASTAGGGR